MKKKKDFFFVLFFTFILNPHCILDFWSFNLGGKLQFLSEMKRWWVGCGVGKLKNCSHFRWEDFKVDVFHVWNCNSYNWQALGCTSWSCWAWQDCHIHFTLSLKVRQSSCSAAAGVLRWVRAKTFHATCVYTGQRCAVTVKCWVLDPVHIFQLLSAASAVFCLCLFREPKVFSLTFHLHPPFHFLI